MPDSATTHGPLDFYRSRFEIENDLTRNVLKAIPSDRLDYRPHERSPSTGQIVWTIVRGLYIRTDIASQGATDAILDPHPSFAEMIERFEDKTRQHTLQLESLSPEQWATNSQVRAGGHIALEGRAGDIMWFFHFDAIHHRGQLSTYLRPMGAKVPSIYGPSGDSGIP